MREIVSGKGTRFVLCQKSHEDERFAKYPLQPIGRCAGYEGAASQPVQPPAQGQSDSEGD